MPVAKPKTLDGGVGLGPLLALLQITDSLFPSGSFAHSYGLEKLFESRRQVGRAELSRVVLGIWRGQLLRTEGLLGLHAHRAFVSGNLPGVVEADRRLLATKVARELREASVATGRGFLSVACAVIPKLAKLGELVDTGRTPGNYAVLLHVAAAAAGAGEEATGAAWGYQTVAQMTAAMLRLGALGHSDAQLQLAELRGEIEGGIREIASLGIDDVSSFGPLLEIASFRHERQYSRLFRS